MSDIFSELEQEETPEPNKKIKAVKAKGEQIILEDTNGGETPLGFLQNKPRNNEEQPIAASTLKYLSTQELLDELYSRAHDERVKILVDKAQRNLFDLKHGANDNKIKAAFEKVYRQEVEGNIRAAKSLVK
jgi:hypothetical protein